MNAKTLHNNDSSSTSNSLGFCRLLYNKKGSEKSVGIVKVQRNKQMNVVIYPSNSAWLMGDI